MWRISSAPCGRRCCAAGENKKPPAGGGIKVNSVFSRDTRLGKTLLRPRVRERSGLNLSRENVCIFPKHNTNPHLSNADGGHFCELLVSNINCLPHFLQICSFHFTCRHLPDFGLYFISLNSALNALVLYLQRGMDCRLGFVTWFFYCIRLSSLCIGLIPFCDYKIAHPRGSVNNLWQYNL